MNLKLTLENKLVDLVKLRMLKVIFSFFLELDTLK